MNIEEAKLIFENSEGYVAFQETNDPRITLDGKFTLTELEAIIFLAKNNQQTLMGE